MATHKQIIERVIQRTKVDELRWQKFPSAHTDDCKYETLVSEGDIGILFEGELMFTEPSGRTRFSISIEVLDIDNIGITLEIEIVASIERQIPLWVVEGLWPKSQGV